MPCALSSINCAGQPCLKGGHDDGIGGDIRVIKSRKGEALSRIVTHWSAWLYAIPARASLGRDDERGARRQG